MWQVTTKEKRYLWDWKRMMSSSSKGLKLNATKIAFFNHLAQFDWFGNFGVNLYPNYINRKSVSSIVVRETEGPDSFARKVFELLFHRTKKQFSALSINQKKIDYLLLTSGNYQFPTPVPVVLERQGEATQSVLELENYLQSLLCWSEPSFQW